MVAPKSTRKSYSTQLTPLAVVSLFLSFTEITLGVVATKTQGGVQIALTGFVIIFPILVAVAFFWILWKKAFVFYPPDAYGQTNVADYVDALKDTPNLAVRKTGDLSGEVKIFGDPDRFVLLFKASGKAWSRSTKAMEVPGGCLVQVSTKFMSLNGEWDLAEALSFIPGASIAEEAGKSGKFLSST